MSKKPKNSPSIPYTGYVKNCHTGNFTVYTLGKASLMCGGWSKDAFYDGNTVVIDLTGNENPNVAKAMGNTQLFNKLLDKISPSYYEWLSLPIKDFGLPKGMSLEVWTELKDAIVATLKQGHNVLICCQGGHGRTGMAISILGNLLHPKSKEWADPVKHLRSIYCSNAVDTTLQEQYVYDTLGLDLKAKAETYAPPFPITTATCPVCKTVQGSSWWVTTYGLCFACAEECKAFLEKQAKDSEKDVHTLRVVKAETNNCLCGDSKCNGISLSKCGHVVHNQKESFDNDCDYCYELKKPSNKGKPMYLGGDLYPDTSGG